jgi:uncharacterized beta barrel domain-containing protein DUF5777
VTMRLFGLVLATLVATGSAFAQTTTSGQATTAQNTAAQATQNDDPDRDLNLAQPDFTLAALPTTLRLPRFRSAFRVTHRFGRPLGAGDFGDLLEDFFGLDNGALIGLEYRFGVFRGAQLGIHRTSNKTIEFFGQYDVKSQRDGFPFGIAAYVSAEGTNNFRDSYSPGIGVLLSREIGDRAAVYVEPFWVNNTNALPEELVDDNNTVIIGLAARVRIRPTVYLVLEGAPRVTGYEGGTSENPGVAHVSFGIEKRAGGHLFQLNFSNSFGTTLADIARGGANNDDWYLGFNISRKFFR